MPLLEQLYTAQGDLTMLLFKSSDQGFPLMIIHSMEIKRNNRRLTEVG